MYGSSQKGNFFKSLLIALGDCLMVFLAMLAALASMGEKYDISSLNLAPVIVYAVAFCAVCFGLDMYSIINRKKSAEPAAAPAAAPAAPAVKTAPAPGTAGKIALHDVPDKTAAMLMAIVASKTGKPLNQLRFISIREIKD